MITQAEKVLLEQIKNIKDAKLYKDRGVILLFESTYRSVEKLVGEVHPNIARLRDFILVKHQETENLQISEADPVSIFDGKVEVEFKKAPTEI